METEEFYSIDINDAGTHIIYGGKSEILYISSFPTLKIIHRIDDFSDSIIFARFVEKNYFVVASIDGILSLYFYEEDTATEINRIDLREDISKIEYFGTSLGIGTVKGSIYFLRGSFNNEIYLTGHTTEIKDMFIVDRKLYTLSRKKLIVHDISTEVILEEFNFTNFITFCYSPINQDIMLASEIESVFINNNANFNFGAECILHVNNVFISGGDYGSINVIDDTTYQYSRYDFNIQNEVCEGIIKIISLGQSIIAFSTFCGKIGAGDYTKPSSYRFFDAGVGVILDFKFYYRHIVVCGINGMNSIDL